MFNSLRPITRCGIPIGRKIFPGVGAGGAFDSKKSIVELVDRGSCMADPTSLDGLEVTPLPYAP